MSKSSNPQHFFETDASQAKRLRKEARKNNKHGSPMFLASKLNAIVPDPEAPHACVFVAESGNAVRRINLETGVHKKLYKGPDAPLTSVAIGGANNGTVFAGCWDKHIWSWKIDMGSCAVVYEGHSDFVKAVVCATISGVPVLISGGADKKIMVWDVATGARLHVLTDEQDAMMAVQCLAIDPAASTFDEIVVVSAGSDPRIRRWRITLTEAEKLPGPLIDGVAHDSILQHETGVFQIRFDNDGDLWTASADGTTKCLVRENGWTPSETIGHGDFVRSVAVSDRFVATAGRSEDVKVWDRATGDLRYVLEGHFDEVIDMTVLRHADGKETLVSVGIDATIRKWNLDDDSLAAAVADATRPATIAPPPVMAVLTADEEAELAELMDV